MYINQIERNIVRPAADKVSARKPNGEGASFDSLLTDAVELTSATDSDEKRKNLPQRRNQQAAAAEVVEIVAGELDIKV